MSEWVSTFSFLQSPQRLVIFCLHALCEEHRSGFERQIFFWLFAACICLLFSSEITTDVASGATLNPELLPLCLVAKQPVMSPRVSQSNIRNGFLNVGCTQFKMN